MKRPQGEARTLNELATLIGGELHGDPHTMIQGVAGIEDAGPGEITFAENLKKAPAAVESKASAVLLPPDGKEVAARAGKPCITVENPRLGFARLLAIFTPQYDFPPGVHPSSVVAPTAKLGKNVSVGARVVIEDGAEVGENVHLYPGVYVGHDAVIGDDTVIHANVTIRERVQIGKRVIIHAGTVIGSDGFGFVTVAGKHHKVPHIGTVMIGDDVEIGANVAIDRGTSGATVIGRGTKMDNLIQIGHNVQVGEDCLIVAQVGIAGSTRLGDHVTIAGQAGISGHLKIGENSVVAACSMVISDLPPGSFVSGEPAQPHTEEMRCQAALRRLPAHLTRFRELEKEVARLARSIGHSEPAEPMEPAESAEPAK